MASWATRAVGFGTMSSIAATFLVVTLTLVIVCCRGSGSTPQNTKLRVVNGLASAITADLNGKILISNLPVFADTGYLSVSTGPAALQI